uniref:Uncharacterized protein n=1 Tax=Rhizophora mucronata TaxID=61149 RepID=A0A2P2PKS8_RHIMU
MSRLIICLDIPPEKEKKKSVQILLNEIAYNLLEVSGV